VDFVAVVDQAIALLRQRGRLMYRTLQVQLQLAAEHLAALTEALIEGQHFAVDEAGCVLVWSGVSGATASPAAAPSSLEPLPQAPLASTPPSLAEKMLTSRSALEDERKQVPVLCADLKGSMERLADRDPAEARPRLDPVLERMMAAVHRLPHAPLHGGSRDPGGGTRPPHHQPPLMQQPTPWTPDHPAMVREACAAHLRRTAAFAPGADHLAPRRVDDAEDCRSGQEDLRPVGLRRVKTHEPGPRGEAGQQRPRVTRHPASAGPVAHACAGRQQSHGDHLTGPEVGLRRCGDSAHLRIDLREQRGDQRHVIMLRASHEQDGTFPAGKRRLTTARPNNVSYALAECSRHCVVCPRRTPGVHKEG
jgi:hypothetical protein